MTRFARFFMLTILLVAGFTAGCSQRAKTCTWYPHACTETLGQTDEEHYQSVNRIREHDRRALNEDLDMFFQTDRPSRLNRWHDK
jgi:hypothetical protein